MKILIAADNNLSTVGGEQESTKIIISGVSRRCDVLVLQPGDPPPLLKASFPRLTEKTRLKFVFKNPLRFGFYIAQVFREIRKFNPDVIHTQAQVSFFIIGLLGFFRLLPRRAKIVHTERGIYSKYGRLIRSLFILFFRRLDVLVLTTELNREYWQEAISGLKRKPENVVIENTAGPLYEAYFPEKAHFNESGKVSLGFAGRYCDWKNWPLAEEIISKLESKYPGNVYVHMAVGCLDEKAITDTEAMFLRCSQILKERFEGRINAPFSEMVGFYVRSDFFILTSWPGTESFGRTVVEAMSAGCLVLTTDGGGPKEVLGNDEFVFSCASEACAIVARAIESPDFFFMNSFRNKKRALTRYSSAANVDKHMKLYSRFVYAGEANRAA